MFSGKTEELLRRIRRAQIAKLPVALFKPSTDTRYDNVEVVSHDKNAMMSIVVSNSQELWNHVQTSSLREPGRSEGYSIVAVDEAQFFDAGLPQVCNDLANQGYRVIVAGLDLDYEGRPFGPMPELLALAEEVTKLHAVCVETGRAAHFSSASWAASRKFPACASPRCVSTPSVGAMHSRRRAISPGCEIPASIKDTS